MRGVNRVILVGTLGKDPETKTFSNGGSLTQFSIATSDSWTDKNTGERKEQTEWHRIVLHNRLGEIAQQYLRKGSKVYIEGSLRTRQWTDQNGQERYTTEIRGEQMQVENITFSDYFLWKEGIYCFENERLISIIKKLELYYDVTIIVHDPQIFNVTYTGKFRQRDGIDEILKVLSRIRHFHVKKDVEKNIITLSK